MSCPQCTTEMVEAKATNFGDTYLYCRTCKKELKEMQSAPASDTRGYAELMKKTYERLMPADEYSRFKLILDAQTPCVTAAGHYPRYCADDPIIVQCAVCRYAISDPALPLLQWRCQTAIFSACTA